MNQDQTTDRATELVLEVITKVLEVPGVPETILSYLYTRYGDPDVTNFVNDYKIDHLRDLPAMYLWYKTKDLMDRYE